MKKTAKVILSSAMTMAMCASLIAGSTLALFTSEDSVNIAITSGKVDVAASIANLQYAADVTETYETWHDATEEGGVWTGTFPDVGGTVRFEGNSLALTEFVPGDAVKFNLTITNNSTISIKYRVRLVSDDSVLAQYLKVTVDGNELSLKGTTAIQDEWNTLAVGGVPAEVSVQIALPAAVTHEQVVGGSNCELKINVYAVQANAPAAAPCDETGEHSLGADGVCFYCGKKVVNSEPTSVEQFNELLDTLQDPNSEVHVTLEQDVINEDLGDIVVTGTAEFNLGNHQLRANSGSNGETLTAQDGGNLTVNAENPGASSSNYNAGMLKAINGGQITINGTGKFKGGNPNAYPATYRAAINADNGMITINGGTFYCTSYQSTMVKSFNGGIVTINGGKISCDNGGRMLDADGGKIIVNGGTLDLVDNAAIWFNASNGGEIVLGSGVTFSRRNAGKPQYFAVSGEGSRIVVYKDITNPGMITLEEFINQGKDERYHVEDLGDRWELTAIS